MGIGAGVEAGEVDRGYLGRAFRRAEPFSQPVRGELHLYMVHTLTVEEAQGSAHFVVKGAVMDQNHPVVTAEADPGADGEEAADNHQGSLAGEGAYFGPDAADWDDPLRSGRRFLIRPYAHIGVGLAPEDLELLVTQPDLVRRWCLLQADFAIAVGRALVAADCPAVILGGGDLAGNLGPFYSPAMFRALVLPAYVKALSALNALGVHYIFRSDGNLWALMDMLFREAGCPGYGETDRDASMTVAAVRARFPRLVIWGNVSSALAARGTAAQAWATAGLPLSEILRRNGYTDEQIVEIVQAAAGQVDPNAGGNEQ